MAAVPARPLTLPVAAVEVARPGGDGGRGRRRDDRRWAARRRCAQQLRSLEIDDALAAEPVCHLRAGRERSRAEERVAEEVARRARRWLVAGRRRRDVGDLRREAAEPRRHRHPARLRDAGVRDRQREDVALGAILHLVAGDVVVGLPERGRGEGRRTEQRDELNLHPVHGKATRLAGAVGGQPDAAFHC